MDNLSKGTGFGQRPKALVCHICGREFGTKSLSIHIKACAEKWEKAEALKPPRERRPVPQAPEIQAELPIGATQADLNRRNEVAMAAFEKQAMVECPNCHRTFLEDRLPVHQRSCTSENPAKSVHGKSGEEGKSSLAATVSIKKPIIAEEVKSFATVGPARLQQALNSSPEVKQPAASGSPQRSQKPGGAVKQSPLKSGAAKSGAQISAGTIGRPDQQQTSGLALFCPSCGSKYIEGAKFCSSCGVKRPS